MVKARFRKPAPLPIQPPPAISNLSPLRALRRNCSVAVAASIDRADNAKFLEKFRYTIISSQLLSGESVAARRQNGPGAMGPPGDDSASQSLLSTEGIFASVLAALVIAIVLSWILEQSSVTGKRLVLLVALLVASIVVGQVYMRRQLLKYRRQQSLREMTSFVATSFDFDSATEATLALVQEVELVSRGYRISAPLPPISRLEDRTQTRKCIRLRRALKRTFADVLETYGKASTAMQSFSDQTELEKYYDMYDISDFDLSDAAQGFQEAEFEDLESLRTLKTLAARFYTIRKMLLCGMLALDADSEKSDLMRWTAVVEALRSLNKRTKPAYDKLFGILSEEESFPTPPTPQVPLTPGRERWRSQLRKLGSLSTGIRGLQAKLHLLREESDRALDDSTDISEMGPNLMAQYDSIGVDLKELMAVWEDGKAALAHGIDRNEKRLSSMSTLLSPRSSILSNVTTANEGGSAADAFKALTGESPTQSPQQDQAEFQSPEVFEAVAKPRQRSTLTREERIVKMKEDREQKAEARQQMDATRGMLRELETVINLRPKLDRSSQPPSTPTPKGARLSTNETINDAA